MLTFRLAFLALVVLVAPAQAHGGVFRGPSSAGSGGQPSGPGAAAPGSAGPAGTGGTSGAAASDPASWSVWWAFNRDPWMGLRERLFRTRIETSSNDFSLGVGEVLVRADWQPTERQKSDVVLPALERVLETAETDDLITAALLALARVAAPRDGDRTAAAARIRGFVAHSGIEVPETALLALGVVGDPGHLPFLRDVLLDTRAGREAVGESEVEFRRRAFAAYALGLAGARAREDVRRFAVGALVQALGEGHQPRPDLYVAAITSFGMLPLPRREPARAEEDATEPPTASRSGQIDYLLGLLADTRRDDHVRAHAPRAIARLVMAPEGGLEERELDRVVDALIHLSRPRSPEPAVVQSGCVLALGELADCDEGGRDERVRDHLIALRGASDSFLDRFARVSLGLVAGRDGEGDPEAGRKQALGSLVDGAARGGTAGRRWSALALALAGKGIAAEGHVPPPELVRVLSSELEDARTPADVGAFAIACGLLGDPAVTDVVLEKLDDTAADEPRGYVAVALGLLGDRKALDPLRKLVDEARYRPALLRNAAIALGLVGDRTAAQGLARRLLEARSLATRGSLTSALGLVGDRRSVEVLVDLMEDEEQSEHLRSFATAALGIVADPAPYPWTTPISRGVNYRSSPVTLHDVGAGRGVLNLL